LGTFVLPLAYLVATKGLRVPMPFFAVNNGSSVCVMQAGAAAEIAAAGERSHDATG